MLYFTEMRGDRMTISTSSYCQHLFNSMHLVYHKWHKPTQQYTKSNNPFESAARHSLCISTAVNCYVELLRTRTFYTPVYCFAAVCNMCFIATMYAAGKASNNELR